MGGIAAAAATLIGKLWEERNKSRGAVLDSQGKFQGNLMLQLEASEKWRGECQDDLLEANREVLRLSGLIGRIGAEAQVLYSHASELVKSLKAERLNADARRVELSAGRIVTLVEKVEEDTPVIGAQ